MKPFLRGPAGAFAVIAASAFVTAQEPLQCDATIASGGTLTIDVASNDTAITITNTTTGASSIHTVGPGKTVAVVVTAPAGSVLMVRVGRGTTAGGVRVEVQ